MSDKMNKLKEVAGESELDKELLNLIAGGNKAETEDLWRFYMANGAGDFLKQYENDHAAGVLAALKKEEIPFKNGMKSISNATSDEDENIYHCKSFHDMSHTLLMIMLDAEYSRGHGYFAKYK